MYKLKFQPQNVGAALVFAEAHLKAIGLAEFSPTSFVKQAMANGGEVSAAIFPLTKLRIPEVVPGLRMKNGSSIIDIVRSIPTNKEVVYKTNRGGLFRMPTEKFVQLATQQGYKKIWNVKTFLITLKELLKPVLDSVPLMWIMKWILGMLRGRKGFTTDKVPMSTEHLERGTKIGSS